MVESTEGADVGLDAQRAVDDSRQTESSASTVPWPVVGLSGDVDVFTAPAVLETILAAGVVTGVIVDFSGVDFVGVAAVNVLVSARHRLRSDGGGDVVVRSPTRLLTLMLDLFGLTDMIEEAAPMTSGLPRLEPPPG